MDPRLYPSGAEPKDFVAMQFTSSAAIPPTARFVELNSPSAAIAMTIDHPRKGNWLIITQVDAGTSGHTVTLPSGKSFNTTNSGDGTLTATTVATFNKAGETLVLFAITDTQYLVVENLGQVGLA